MRYYQSLMDTDALFKGGKYTDLKENYVIFICMFDPFEKELPIYTFENMCREKPDLKLGDKSYKVCYNVNAFEKAASGKVKAFLKYVKTQSATDSFTRRLEDIVSRSKESKVFRRYYMMRNIFIDDWIDQGKAEGIAIGEERGMARGAHEKAIETARGMLAYGIPHEKVAEISSLPMSEVQQLQSGMKADL